MKPGCANRWGDGRLSVSQAPPRSPRPRCLGCILRAAFSNQAGSLCGGVCPGGRDPAHPKTPEVLLVRAPCCLNGNRITQHTARRLETDPQWGSGSLQVFTLGSLWAQSCRLPATPLTAPRQAPRSAGFPRQGYWSGVPFPPPGGLPDPGVEPQPLASPALAGRLFTTSASI